MADLPLIVEEFIDADASLHLVKAFDSFVEFGPPPSRDFRAYPNRTEVTAAALAKESPVPVAGLLSDIRSTSRERMKSYFGIGGPLCSDFTLVSRMAKGDWHPLHADNESMGESGVWVPNHTPWRTHTAMLYLNSEGEAFEGGVLRFAGLDLRGNPRAGLLVGFRCDHSHRHEVETVRRGFRHAISLWFTYDPSRAEDWAF
jgi:predicted 2-oxoglutarate/Fe(II)-dependent dioxygenase YbiX